MMFKIECLVRASQLGKVLTELDGKVAELAVRPIKNTKPTTQSQHNHGAYRDVIKSIIDQFTGDFTRDQVIRAAMASGVSAGTAGTTVQRLHTTGKIQRVGKGTYRRTA